MGRIASFVLGLISIILGFIAWFAFGWLCIPALVCGIIGLTINQRGPADLILNIIGTSFATVGLIVYIITLCTVASAV